MSHCVSRQEDHQVLFYNGTVNRLLLEVNVTNSNNPLSPGSPAEDAHNPVLNVSIPALLIFAGVRTKVLKVRASGRRRRGAGTGPGPDRDWSVLQSAAVVCVSGRHDGEGGVFCRGRCSPL